MNSDRLTTGVVAIAVLAAGLLLQGCTSVHSISVRSPSLAQGDKVILAMNNGDSKKLEYVSINEVQIEGFDRKGNLQTVNIEEVRSLSVRRFDGKKTGLLIGGIAVGVATAAIGDGIEDALSGSVGLQ